MKKLLAILAALAMAFSLYGCGDKEAYDLYMDMEAAMAKAKSVEMSMNADIDMTVSGQTVNIKMDGTVKEVIRSQTDVDMQMDMVMDLMGQKVDAKSFYTDGYMYQDVMGQKIKTAVPMEDAASQINMLESFNFSKEAVKSSSVTDVEGGKQLDFELDAAAVNEMMSDLTSSLTGSMGLQGADITFGDIKYSAVAGSDNRMKSCNIIFDMTLNIEGEAVSAKYDMSMTGLSYDKLDKIDFPSDLSEYTEM